jgi:hypothetical protein
MVKPLKFEPERDTFLDTAQALVDRLRTDVIHESCVVFMGAGSTTERGLRRGTGFYEGIMAKAPYPSEPNPSFPLLMEHFCSVMDGGQHNRLVREAISYIERFGLAGEDNRSARMASDAFAEIPYFNRFVTTNWDPFIERALDVLGV